MSIRIPPESKLTVHLPMDLFELTESHGDLVETACIIRALPEAEAMANKNELDTKPSVPKKVDAELGNGFIKL